MTRLIAGVALVAYVAGFAFITRDYFVDDAYIGFQFIRNLLLGQGFVFFPGQPAVEGVTNIGWLVLLAPFSLIAPPPIVAKVLGLVLIALALVLSYRLSGQLIECHGPPALALALPLVPALLLASSFDYLYFSLAGMETGLLALLLLWMIWCSKTHPESALLPVAGWFAFTVHPEAVLVYPLYALTRLTSSGADRKGIVRGLVVFGGLIVLTTAARVGYFHALLPNTFGSKPASSWTLFAGVVLAVFGRHDNLPFPLSATLVPALFLMAQGQNAIARRSQSAATMTAAILLTGLLFCLYARPDWTMRARYFAPYLPATLLLLWAGVVEVVWRRLKHARLRPWRPAITTVLAGGLTLTALLDTTLQLRPERIDAYPGYVLTSHRLVEAALWVRDNLDDDAVIATRRIGVLAYYSDRRVFDYVYGLAEPAVSRLVAQRRQAIDSPTAPELASLWQTLQPEALLEDNDVLDRVVAEAGGSWEDFTIHGQRYRVVRSFALNEQVRWVLALRAD